MDLQIYRTKNPATDIAGPNNKINDMTKKSKITETAKNDLLQAYEQAKSEWEKFIDSPSELTPIQTIRDIYALLIEIPEKDLRITDSFIITACESALRKALNLPDNE